MQSLNSHQVLLEIFLQATGQHRDSVLLPLPISHGHLVIREVEVLDPQPQTLHQTQP